jgi:hypothetical protein
MHILDLGAGERRFISAARDAGFIVKVFHCTHSYYDERTG